MHYKPMANAIGLFFTKNSILYRNLCYNGTKEGENMTDQHTKILWCIALIIFVLFMAAVAWFVGRPMVQFAEEPEAFRRWVESAGVWGQLVFVGMVVLQVLVAIIPGEPIELVAGYAFGFVKGSILTLIGFLIGSWLVFILVRKFGIKLVEVFFSREKLEEIRFVKNEKKTRVIMLIIMLIPGTPKDMISYFAGLTKLTVWEWLAIVAIGRLPSLMTSTVTGAAAGVENYWLSGISLAVTAVITLVGIWYYRRICKQEKLAEEETL